MQDKVVFYEKDMKLVHLPANLSSLGLLQAVEGLTLLSKSLSYNFLHLSVQELLATYHISHMDSSEQLEVFRQIFGSFRFQAVLHYYSGFTRLANPTIQDFISTYSQQKSSIEDVLPLLHCFYEAQEPSLCNLITFRIIGLGSHLNPVDYLAIGYYITSLLSVPSSDTSNICLMIETIDDHRLRLLLLELSKYRTISACAARLEIEIVFSTNIIEKTSLMASFLEQSSAVSKLMIQHKDMDNKTATDVFPSFAKALQSNSSLTTLTIKYQGQAYEHTCKEDFQVVKNMFEINNSLTHFSLSGTGGFACCILQGLQHNKKLTHLNLRGTRLVATEDIGQALTTMLQVNKTLTHLDLTNLFVSGTWFSFEGLQCNTTLVQLNLRGTGLVATAGTAQALTTMLQANKTLTHLDLSNNWKFQNASCIFQGLQNNATLVYLNLSNIKFEVIKDTSLAKALTTMLQVNKTLTHLDLSNNWKFQNASCIFQGLLNNTTLVYLNLSNMKLEVKKDTPLAKAFTTMLQENKHLKHLDLSHNPLYDEGVYCLCEGLQHNTTLVYLNLNDTGITDKGAEWIARAYNSNRSLQLTVTILKNYIIGVYTRMKDSWMNDTLKLIYR